jgi:heptosyltransferase III
MKKNIIYRIGSLGDNLVALPSIWAVKDNFPDSKIYLLSNQPTKHNRVTGSSVFDGSNLFQGFLTYPSNLNFWQRMFQPILFLKLLIQLRFYRFDTLIYLAPSERRKNQIHRDRLFFSLAGIKKIIGMQGFEQIPPKVTGIPLSEVPREADSLLTRLKASGLKVPESGMGKMDLNLNEKEEVEFKFLLTGMPSDNGRKWIGIGPSSNMTAKIWPTESYIDVLKKLIEKRDIWPVIFGGGEDCKLGENIIKTLGCGYNMAGKLSVRLAALGLKRCLLYLGNDTGTMHLAAAVSTPCVALFSSRSYPGQWYPYGSGHKIFRTQIECEGCGLVDCIEKKMECLTTIKPDEVFKVCKMMLDGLSGNARDK